MRLLFTLVVVEFGNCQLASLIDAIDSFTEGSGFAFEEFFPNITAEDFTFDAILDEIDSLFSKCHIKNLWKLKLETCSKSSNPPKLIVLS